MNDLPLNDLPLNDLPLNDLHESVSVRGEPRASQPQRRHAISESFRPLIRASGASYLLVAFVARLPVGMAALGVLTLVADATGSIAVAGAAGAAAALGQAAGGPLIGLLAERWGQRAVMSLAATLDIMALAALAAGASRLPTPALLALTLVVGAATTPAGSLSRVRWARMAPAALPAAMSLEGGSDEVAFVLGPALIGVVGVLAGPRAGIVLTAVVVAVGITAFALHPTAASAGGRRPRTADAAGSSRGGARAGGGRLIVVPMLGLVAMGAFFGSSQTSLTAAARGAGSDSAGGLLYAVMATGSAFTALAMVGVPGRISLWRRWITTATGLLAGAAAMALAVALPARPALPGVVATVVLAGLFVGPTMVTCTSLVGSLAPPERLGVCLTTATSGLVIGSASGSALAGVLAQAHGPAAGFAVCVAAALAVVVLPAVAGRRMRRAGA